MIALPRANLSANAFPVKTAARAYLSPNSPENPHARKQQGPALDGVDAKLAAGASVADVGCGHSASVVVVAEAYPNSRFAGFDYHEPSIATTTRREIA
jgi:tRNA G46 methylase TrmB